jgi:hypothetical protein
LPDVPSLSGRRVATLVAAAAALHGVFDAVSCRIPLAVPPYLRLEDAPEAFQMLSLVAVSIAVCSVSGIIAAIAVAVVPWPERHPLLLGVIVTGFWLFSALLLRLVWMTTPWPTTAIALLMGVPRGLVIGWCLARICGAGVSDSTDGAA